MKNIINQIYWDRTSDTYMNGSSLKKSFNGVINFTNKLMPAGKSIIKWNSLANYQSVKEVPSLPILLKGQEYRLKVDAEIKPENLAIFTIRFFDLQDNEIDKIIFTNDEQKFIYPENAVRYEIEIINGGCEKINFNKIQLAPADLEEDMFNNFYTYEIYSSPSPIKNYLILVHDSKRVRKIAPFKIDSKMNINLTIGYLSWQGKFDQKNLLEDYLKTHNDSKITIFSSDLEWDKMLATYESDLKNIDVIFSDQFIKTSDDEKSNWLLKDYQDMDQISLVQRALDYFKE